MNRKSVVVPKRSLVQDGIVAYRAAGLPGCRIIGNTTLYTALAFFWF